MSKYLVTGSSGTGKSTVQKELHTRGLNAVDADARELELCSWFEIATGRNLGRGFPADFSVEKYDWRWDEKILRQLLTLPGEIFICGNANNAPDFYHLFDRVFVLHADEVEQRRRINVRTEHDFAKDEDTQNRVIKRQQELVEFATRIGATIIDASPSAERVADTILTCISKDCDAPKPSWT